MSDALTTLTADASSSAGAVSPTLYGLFYEDLNRASDGGLNANVVANHTFDGVYLERRFHNELIAMATKRRGRITRDPLRHWTVTGGALTAMGGHGAPSPSFARIGVQKTAAVIRNSGYQPSGRRDVPTIAVRAGIPMLFSAWVDVRALTGTLEARLVTHEGTIIGATAVHVGAGGWRRVDASISVRLNARTHLELVIEGSGYLDLDEVSLVAADHWGAGDPRWSQGLLRRDLVEALAALKPTFIRFPGGCVVEGMGGDNAYDWKRTVGPLATRRPDYNLWGLRVPEGDYSQSQQLGYYEFFLLCEDLGSEPMPIVPAGISCQFRSKECIRSHEPEFDRVIQDVLDLIDWITGDPADNAWARLRAEAGHPEPFPLTYLGIGNENHGAHYYENYARIRDAVQAKHPGIIPVLSAGPFAQGKAFDEAWMVARQQPGPVLVDEHFYKKPDWFIEQAARYDQHPRDGAKVFIGEYAARSVTGKAAPNTFDSALAEAAFLTGVERNSDVIAMTSYAPLLNNVGTRLWPHNLLDFNPDTVMHTPNYEVQKLFATSVGEEIITIAGDLPDGVLASSTATATRQNVKLVNTSSDVVTVELRLPCAADGQYRTTRLEADLDATNRLPFEGEGSISMTPTSTRGAITRGEALVVLPPRSVSSIDVDLAKQATS